MEFSRPQYWTGSPFPSPGDLPNPGMEPRFSTLQEDSLPAKPQGKPKNTGVSRLSLLQWIFPTQGSDQVLPHCRQILHQLSHPGKPKNIGVGSRSLLQQISLTQELNRVLLHCKWILYQLSYQGSLASSKLMLKQSHKDTVSPQTYE